MATNLRLRQDAADAVRREAQRTGRSQQEVIREALDRHLGLSPRRTEGGEMDTLITTGAVRPPRTAYRKATERLSLPQETTSAELLDRQDRI